MQKNPINDILEKERRKNPNEPRVDFVKRKFKDGTLTGMTFSAALSRMGRIDAEIAYAKPIEPKPPKTIGSKIKTFFTSFTTYERTNSH